MSHDHMAHSMNSSGGHGMHHMDHGSMDHGSMDHGSMDHGSMNHGDHAGMDHSMHKAASAGDPCSGGGQMHGMMVNKFTK